MPTIDETPKITGTLKIYALVPKCYRDKSGEAYLVWGRKLVETVTGIPKDSAVRIAAEVRMAGVSFEWQPYPEVL